MIINVEALIYPPSEKHSKGGTTLDVASFSFPLEITPINFREIMSGMIRHSSGMTFQMDNANLDYDPTESLLKVFGILPSEGTSEVIEALKRLDVKFNEARCRAYGMEGF
ncbi:MAG: hypothetical protein AAB381_00855 [Patescibacteria group bacterium]